MSTLLHRMLYRIAAFFLTGKTCKTTLTSNSETLVLQPNTASTPVSNFNQQLYIPTGVADMSTPVLYNQPPPKRAENTRHIPKPQAAMQTIAAYYQTAKNVFMKFLNPNLQKAIMVKCQSKMYGAKFGFLLFMAVLLFGAVLPMAAQVTNYNTPGTYSYTVPAGVTSLDVTIYGAQGGVGQQAGSANNAIGGKGGRVTAKLAVTPGQVLQVNVGGQGVSPGGSFTGSSTGGNNGGGDSYSVGTSTRGSGGGASDIRTGVYSLAERVLVAGGGGGATGGNQTNINGGNGGDGGGTSGVNGVANSTTFGSGGTQVAGGVISSGSNPPLSTGTLGTGGSGAQQGAFTYAWCGGGGGYWGGGAGIGAGGGSSYIAGVGVSGASTTAGIHAGNGLVTISACVVRPVTNTTTLLTYCNIQSAIDDPLTLNGHTITVAAGTYNESVLINKSITLKGAQQGVDPRPSASSLRTIGGANESIIVAAKNQTVININADNVVIDGFEITQSGGSGAAHTIVTNANYAGISFINNIVTNTTTSNAMRLLGGQDFLIQQNYLKDIPGEGIVLRNGNLALPVATNQRIKNNDIINQFGVAGGAIYTYGQTGMEISGNIINAKYQGIAIGATGPSYYAMQNIDAHHNEITMEMATTGGQDYGILINGLGDNINIHNNIITDVSSNTGTKYALIKVGYNADLASVTNPSNLVINNNFLSRAVNENYLTVGANITNAIYAACNWWNSVSSAIIASRITAPAAIVTYSPFLNSGTDTDPSTGFTPVPGACACPSGNVITNTNTSMTFCSIQEAIDNPLTVNGNTITVSAGTYNENVVVNKELTIKGANFGVSCLGGRGAESIINGMLASNTATVNVSSNAVTIDGFTITNALGSYGISENGKSNLDFEHNIITNIGNSTSGSGSSWGVYLEAGNSANSSTVTVSNNCINNIRGGANTSLTGAPAKANNGSGGAILVASSNATKNISGLTISSNKIDNCTANTSVFADGGKGAYGLNLSLGASGAGSVVSPVIQNNEITNLEGLWAHGIGLEGRTPGALVTNNLVDNLVDHKGNTDAIGVQVESNDGAASLNIHENSLTNMVFAVQNVTALTVNATCNWYGTNSQVAISSKINGLVTYIPWLSSGVDNAPGTPGFQPAPGTCTGMPPVITCPAAVTAYTSTANPGQCKASNVQLGVATATGGVPPYVFTYTPVGDYNVGTTTITWTVEDANGNTSSCTQLVTVIDNEKPVITCPAAVTVNNDPGQCYATGVPLGTATATDNCGISTIVFTQIVQYPVGTTVITYTATDVNGNTQTCQQLVTVLDNEKPTITCPANVTVNNTPGFCANNTVVLGTPTATDNCPPPYTFTNDHASPVYPVGTTTVTWTVTDAHGNTQTCTQTVTVLDAENPTVTCVGNQVRSTNLNLCTYAAVGTEFNPASSGDNCAITATTYTVSGAGATPATGTSLAGAVFNKGVTTVTWKVVDAAGNSATCSFTVNVNDNQAPTILCPGDITQNNDNGICGAVVTYALPMAGDNCPGVISITQIAGLASGATFPVGITTNTFRATDVSGNSSTCSFTVTVVDAQAPTVSCVGNQTRPASAGVCIYTTVTTEFNPTASGDNCAVTSTTYTVSGVTTGSGSTTLAGFIFNKGTSTVTWKVQDAAGNSATCSFTVTVVDNQKPTITCAPAVTTTNNPGLCSALVFLTTPTGTDNCPGPLVFTNDHPAAVYPVGTTIVTWTVTDVSGNTQTCTQSVTVNDTENPVIACAGNMTVLNDPNQCYATVTPTPPTIAMDNCGPVTFSYVLSGVTTGSGNVTPVQIIFNLGLTNVLWKITDPSGNSATCNQTVLILDAQAPVITCLGNQVKSTDAGVCTWTSVGIALDATFTDNCTGTTKSYTVTGATTGTGTSLAGFVFNKGVSTVTWKATDPSGNSASCSFTVTVNDTEAPTVTCVGNQTRSTNTNVCTYTAVTTEFNPTATGDNCAVTATTYTVTGVTTGAGSNTLAGFVFNKGVSTVTWKVQDAAGNSTTCSFTVTVNDTQAPTVSCPVNQVKSTNNNVCTWTVPDNSLNATFGDNCPGATITNSYTNTATLNGAVFPKGVTTVTWTVTDASGNSTSCSFSVTVNDTQAPTVSCPVNQVKSTNNNVCTWTVPDNSLNATFADNCPGATISNNYNNTATLNGAIFPKGITTVIWKVTDASGNSASCSFTVTVNDNQKPTITCPANVTVNNTPGQCGNTNVNIGTATTGDNCPGPLTVSNDHPSVVYPGGVTIVTWTVTDVSGNTQTCTQTVTVVDNEKPTITCAGNMTAFNDLGKCYATVTLTPPVATGDNCPGPLVITNNAPVNSQYPVGVTTVTWMVTDVAGNTQTCTQNVTVVDNEKPIITCPGNLIVDNDPGVCGATITLFPATATDNCGVLSIVNNHPSTSYPVGVTIVTWTATDIHGNTQTCTQSVTVVDVQNPTITCVGSQTRSTNSMACTYTTVGTEFNPTASGDNCAVTSTTYTVSGATTGSGSNTLAGFIFQKGVSTVTWKVMDAAGNSATCSFTITVNDDQNPTVSCVGNQTRSSNTGVCTYTTVTTEFNPTSNGDNCGIASITYTVTGATTGSGLNSLAGFVFANGTSTVTWKVIDAAGNSATCSFTVTVNDNQNPTITCVGNQTRSTNTNVCTYTTVATEFNPTLSGDNCGITSTTYTVTGASTGSGSGSLVGFVFLKGTSTVTWKVQDAAGNSTTCSFTVTVNDNQKPTITCAAPVSVGNDAGQCFATVTLTAPTVSDNCPGVLAPTSNHPSPIYPAGVTTVTWTVTDASGNTQTCTQTVTVTINTTITSSVIGVGGTISPLGNTVVTCGGSQSYTMTANAGYVIGDIIVDGVSTNPTPGITTSSYTFTNVTTNHTIAVSFKQIVTADPALLDVYLTDLSNTPINTNLIPFNTVNRVKVRVQNLSFTIVPSGTVTVEIKLGDKLNINPGFDFNTVGLNTQFTWSLFVSTPGAQVIRGVQKAGVAAELAAIYDQTASFDVLSGPLGSSRIDADILTTNHNNATQFLVDANLTDNHAEVNPYFVLNPFVITSVTSTNVSCNGGNNGTITVAVTGGAAPYDFSKDNGANWVLAQSSPYTFTGLTAGNYNIRIRDAVSQVIIHAGNPVVITQPNVLVATASGTNVSCNGGSNGTATVAVTGGTTGYTYLWSPGGQTTQSISGLAIGTYSVTVTDSKGCTAVSSYTVTQPPVLVATASGTNVSCNGGNNGTATVTPTGGTPGYTYLWSPGGQTTQSISGLAAGTYSVLVTDSKGCAKTASYIVTQPAVLVATASGTNVSCNGGNDGTATVAVTGGTVAYTYLWSPGGQTTQSISGLTIGTYSVLVTDSKGCTATSSYTVTQPPVLTIAVTGHVDLTSACVNNGTITVTVGGGTPNYQYAVDGGAYSTATPSTTFTYTGLGSGLHTLYVKDSKGCIKSTTYTLTEPTITNLSLGSDIDNSLFPNNGDIRTIVYNVSEINGKSASSVVLRVFKPSGYNILFNPADASVTVGPTNYTLDNVHWSRLDYIGYTEFTRTGPPAGLPCFDLQYLKISLQRATPNKTLFNLTAVLFPAPTEVDFSSNTNSITFVGN